MEMWSAGGQGMIEAREGAVPCPPHARSSRLPSLPRAARARSTVDGRRCAFPASFGGRLLYDCMYIARSATLQVRYGEGRYTADEKQLPPGANV